MAMQVQRGLVKYKDRSDIICTYGVSEDGAQYYFLDEGKLDNDNIIVSTALVEAIDPVVVSSHVGVIDNNGSIIIPCENKTIKTIANNMILVEKAQPTSESVLESIRLREDPAAATKLVTTPATIKDKINTLMDNKGRFVFNDQFSEATIFDFDGNNLVDGEYYSFIGVTEDKVFLCKNTIESEVRELGIAPSVPDIPEVSSEDSVELNVETTNVTQDSIDNAINEQTGVVDDGAPIVGDGTTPEVETSDVIPLAGEVSNEVSAVTPEEAPAEGEEVALNIGLDIPTGEVPAEGAAIPAEGEVPADGGLVIPDATDMAATDVAPTEGEVTSTEIPVDGETSPVEGEIAVPTDGGVPVEGFVLPEGEVNADLGLVVPDVTDMPATDVAQTEGEVTPTEIPVDGETAPVEGENVISPEEISNAITNSFDNQETTEVPAEENMVSAEDVNNAVTEETPAEENSVVEQPMDVPTEDVSSQTEDFSAMYNNDVQPEETVREDVVVEPEEVATEPMGNGMDIGMNNYGGMYQDNTMNNDYGMNQFNNTNFEDDYEFESPNTNFGTSYDFNDNMGYDNFDSSGLQLPSRNMMNDVTATISNLVEINRNQQSMLDEYEIKLTKCNASRTKYAELSKQQAREIANLNARLGKAEAEIQMLQTKLASLGSATNGELARAIADAQNLIGNTRMRRRNNNMM